MTRNLWDHLLDVHRDAPFWRRLYWRYRSLRTELLIKRTTK